MLHDIPDKQVNNTCIAYAAISIACVIFLQSFAGVPIQLKISEALCIVALFSKEAPFRLMLASLAANLTCMLIFNTYPIGLTEVICGSVATLLGATCCYYYRSNTAKALFWFVFFNALITPIYLPITAAITYNVPLLEFMALPAWGTTIVNYAYAAFFTGISEAIVIYGLGYPFARYTQKKIEKLQAEESSEN